MAVPAVPRGFWQGFISGSNAARKAGRKLETKKTAKKKIAGKLLVKPPDFYSLLFLFMPWEGQVGACSQFWAACLAGASGAALAGFLG